MSKLNRFGLGALVGVLLAAGGVLAGDLTPPGPPGSTMYTLEDIYLAVTGDSNVVNTTSGDALAGDILAPKKAWVDGAEVTGSMATRTLSPANDTVQAGYYAATTLSSVDTDLVAGNIKKDVAIFGVTGTMYNAAVGKTGQTTSYRTGDDGDLEKGVAWPNPRFTVTTNGTDEVVTDNLTGLMWVKAPHSLSGNSGGQTWNNAIDFCNGLTHAGHSDWRLPNVRELQSLIVYNRSSPALPSGHPFTGVRSYYWSSTASYLTDYAWFVSLAYGSVFDDDKTTIFYRVWPVRAGQ